MAQTRQIRLNMAKRHSKNGAKTPKYGAKIPDMAKYGAKTPKYGAKTPDKAKYGEKTPKKWRKDAKLSLIHISEPTRPY